ncbi:MAG: IPT/TIG domain-containing protein [Planctomycetes bacterium]|nr:IPT/TIG domain-containing protein [Planctomycetota bacterium]
MATRLAPTQGITAVDTPILVEGQNLDRVASVAFVPDSGGTPLALSGWTSTASMGSAVVPAGFTPGDYRLELTDTAGTVIRAALVYEVLAAPAPPTLSAVAPDRGANDAPHTVTIQGAGFVVGVAVQVSVGGVPASAANVLSATEVEATLPAGLPAGVQPLELSQLGQTVGGLSWTALNFSDPDVVGGYTVGYLDERIQGASGDRPDVRIYFPAQQAGSGATPDPSGGPYPVVVYNHGFKPPFISFGINYRNNTFIAERLASFGYVVACVDLATNNSLFRTGQENSQRDADDTIATLDHFERANADATHPLFGLLDPTRAALGGHSRGADAALIAGAMEVQARGAASRVRALFAYGPPSTDSQNGNRPLVFGDFTQLPLLLIGGSNDGIAAPAQQRDILALSAAPSCFLELDGGNHSRFKDNSTFILGDSAATLSLADQHDACRRYTTAWLGTHVKGQAGLFADYVLRGSKVLSDARLSAVDVR